MNRFRKMGLIDYNGSLHVHWAMLNFFLHQQALNPLSAVPPSIPYSTKVL
jgi:hypothetical protein